MTRVKMCGMRRPEDARAAALAGATAIGIVFWPSSPRAIGADAAKRVVDGLPAGVPAIGVFVNQDAVEINACVMKAGLAGVQLHGDEPIDLIARLKRPVIRAVTIESLALLRDLPPHVTVLLDAHDPRLRGGTGRTIDWAAAREVARTRHVVLAGGLTPFNVEDAIATVRPYAVDVSSGIESEPGVKDHVVMNAFMDAVRRADARLEAACP
ncbi:MAG: phosphoribosylanthranilate isomerase [Acidobacteriota bacterium]|nr:phosphoribosylanthranilate isomerase [Acidobacteriota bacterium]